MTWYVDVDAASGVSSNVYVFAGDAKTQICSPFDNPAATAWVLGNDYQDANGNYYPNNPTGADAAFNAGNYVNELYVYVEGTSLTFGIFNPNRLGNDGSRGAWITYRDFALTRFDKKEITLDENVAWTPTASPSANVTLKRSFNTNWATFAVPFDIDNETLKAQFGDDVQVSTISADADNLNFSAMQTPAITANEPVIMKVSNTAGTYTFDNVEIKAATPTLTPIEGVQVIGNYSGQITMPASDDATKYYYIASNKLKYTTGTQTLKGFRAYFSVAADSPVKGFFENGYDFEGLPTAIDGLQAEGANATIYNLAGQRVNKAQKGIYIVNGKKVLVK